MEVARAVGNTLPQEMAFRRTWRSYQARLLERLDSCLDDRRLHIVAAPGSGKTVLGLEVVRRINQPTLVLAPTITIRDQWVQRLVEHFLPPGASTPEWVSTNIRQPRIFTVATYQALHALCAGEPEEENDRNGDEPPSTGEPANGEPEPKAARPVELPDVLVQFRTLVVDEAHHLRTEWWRTLTFVAERLSPVLVALTATPPYDVEPAEWERYEELCGPVDAEVAIPELVLQRDLCPHQDYVYFSSPSKVEQGTIDEFRTSVDNFVRLLRANDKFTAAIAAHPWMVEPSEHVEEILDDPEYMSSMVIYLNDLGHSVPREILKTLGVGRKQIPPATLAWLEVLLTHCLYTDVASFSASGSLFKTIRHELSGMGAIERRKVVLKNPSHQTKLLTTSTTKLRSIEEIVQLEASGLQERLRCVILTDFIRSTELPEQAGDDVPFEDIGVVPIFETLRRCDIASVRLGVLCGSLVLVPASCEPMLRRCAASIGIEPDDLLLHPIGHDPRYLSVSIQGRYHDGVVRLVTSVFQQGGVTVLVGTKSLLGEGWDAPAMNTLVLASFVGSYVLSNQMRGRSMRIDPTTETKTANVWHLVCVERGLYGPGNDYELLARRCRAFVGVSADEDSIASGIDRLGLGHPPYTAEELADLNAHTCTRALDRDGLRRRWDAALSKGVLKEVASGLKAQRTVLPRGFIMLNTIAALIVEAISTFMTVLFNLLRNAGRFEDRDPLSLMMFFAGVASVGGLVWVVPALWLLLRHGTPERSIKEIGTAVLHSLAHDGFLKQDESKFEIHGDRNRDGSVSCWISGGTWRDQTIYLRALRDILGPVENPRYLLARKTIWRFFREDYFAVPQIVGRKKESAEFFAKLWSSRVGAVRLIYTRAPEGRRILLRARMHSLAAAFQARPERVSCWK